MSAAIRLVLSDFHLGKGRFLRDGTPNAMEDFQHEDKFVEFLEYYSSKEYAEREVELIINGDFLNLLQTDYLGVNHYLITESKTIYIIRSIMEGHKASFDALRNFAKAKNHKIVYMIGNHDQTLLFPKARLLLLEYIGPNLRFYSDYYEFDGVRIEHGHAYDPISRCDLENYIIEDPMYPEPIFKLPWASLFVASPLPVLKKKHPNLDKVKPFTAYLRWVILYDPLFAIRGGLFLLYSFFRMRSLKSQHPKLDLNLSFARLKGITIYPRFASVAKKILKRNKHLHTVIFGHTHVLYYQQWSGGKEYLNTGTWNDFVSLGLGDLGLQCALYLCPYRKERRHE